MVCTSIQPASCVSGTDGSSSGGFSMCLQTSYLSLQAASQVPAFGVHVPALVEPFRERRTPSWLRCSVLRHLCWLVGEPVPIHHLLEQANSESVSPAARVIHYILVVQLPHHVEAGPFIVPHDAPLAMLQGHPVHLMHKQLSVQMQLSTLLTEGAAGPHGRRCTPAATDHSSSWASALDFPLGSYVTWLPHHRCCCH